MLAARSDAIVIGFNTKITDTARRAAEAEGVDVRLYDIIYKLTDDVEARLKGLLEPEIVEVVEGRAEVRPDHPRRQEHGDRRVVRDRRPDRRGGNARVWRSSKVIATDRIESLRRFRDDVREVPANYECGIAARRTSTTSRRETSSNVSPPDRAASSATMASWIAFDEPATERVDELLGRRSGRS
jgi:translation initiation factor IF-2